MLAVIHVEDIWRTRSRGGRQSRLRHDEQRAPGRQLPDESEQAGATSAAASSACSSQPLRLQVAPPHAGRTARRVRQRGWRRIVAFQTRNPMHRAHHELTLPRREGGRSQPARPPGRRHDQARRRRSLHPRALLPAPHVGTTRAAPPALRSLPLAMRMGGPREAIWHAIIRKNHGCTHLVVGRDHAGPGKDTSGKPFYGPYDAQELMQKHEEELGIKMVDFKKMVYVADEDKYFPSTKCRKGKRTLDLAAPSSATASRRHRDPQLVLATRTWRGAAPQPSARAARKASPCSSPAYRAPANRTIANVLLSKLLELGGRPVTLLDGDLVRKNLSSELGFSKEHRDINIRRIGYVAAEITKHRGIAICAPIAPVRRHAQGRPRDDRAARRLHPGARHHDRRRVRRSATARASTPRPAPASSRNSPASAIPTTCRPTPRSSSTRRRLTPDEAAQEIILHLEHEGYIGMDGKWPNNSTNSAQPPLASPALQAAFVNTNPDGSAP